ncbi:MAG: hypothetical protein VXX88_07955 [Pseudomonadota bacterium]|nr:hypothetical protein [Pseudomonadota bacterium]
MSPRRWTTDELDTANKMLSDGASFVEIGKTIDRSGAAVKAKLKGQGSQRSAAAKKKPKPEPQPIVEREITEPKGTIVEEKPVPTEPHQAEPKSMPRSNDNGQESSTVKYIVGAVIIAVVLYHVLGG